MSASSTVVVGAAVGAASPISPPVPPVVPPAEALASEGASAVGDPLGADLEPTLDSRKSLRASQVEKVVRPATVSLAPGCLEFPESPDWHPAAAKIRTTRGKNHFFITSSGLGFIVFMPTTIGRIVKK